MANLAIVGIHSVNGVARLHTEILKSTDLPRVPPRSSRRSSTTRRTASRRGAGCCRPIRELAALITEAIGDGWPRDLDACASWSRSPTTRRSASAGATVKLHAQGARSRSGCGAASHRRRPGLAVRHPDQAHPRVQAPAPERAARASRSTTACSAGEDCRAAHGDLRRQGRAELLHRQADHQAHPRRRPRWCARTRCVAQRLQRRLRAELRRLRGGGAVPRHRAVRADLDRGHRGSGPAT